jgi:pimeloyl-ACP methyl ester carboxylesterase
MPLIFTFTVWALCGAVFTVAQTTGGGINFQPCPELNANISAILPAVELTTFDCAQVSVPLDYTIPDSSSLNLTLLRVNATEQPALGSVLINWGGPGGTAAENLPALAEQARKYIGPQWNLLSFDPRGTGSTIPFNCSVGTNETTTVSNQKRDELGTLVAANLTEIFLTQGWDDAGMIADHCFNTVDQNTATLIGTAFGARDMMMIVDALNEDGLLRFYGWSYGTALGSYTAAMFPERIGRMVLDANVNPNDYQSGTYQGHNRDTNAAFAGFLETCFQVEDDCALYSLVQPQTAQDLLDVINDALEPLVQNATSSERALATYFAIHASFIEPLYYPQSWPAFAQTLASLLSGDVDPSTNSTPAVVYGEAENAVLGIRASDATFHANSSEEYLPIVQQQATAGSPSFADSYVSIWPSARWRLPAKERYWGDFRRNTSTPILYVNGMYDPVTPLANAYNASAGFSGSAVLAHRGYGHGVFVSPSTCVASHTRAYFLNASLPQGNVTCDPDLDPVELWRATLATMNSNTTSNPGDNSTDGDEPAANRTASNGTAEAPGNAANSWSSSLVSVITAGSLAIAVMHLL